MPDHTHASLEKVTVFVLRFRSGRPELLIFAHPSAGLQLPAGTVEPDEAPRAAARRELLEESGLDVPAAHFEWLTARAETLAGDEYLASTDLTLFREHTEARVPFAISRGCRVRRLDVADGKVTVAYEERDAAGVVRLSATSTVPASSLTKNLHRHFYLVWLSDAESPGNTWQHAADGHLFRFRWTPTDALPALHLEQQGWLGIAAPFFGGERAPG